MKALLAASALLLTGPGTLYFGGMPPERFHAPATVTLKLVEPGALEASCKVTVPAGLTLKGCARRDWMGRKYIIMPMCRQDCDETGRILAHEVGHVLGWSGNHPL